MPMVDKTTLSLPPIQRQLRSCTVHDVLLSTIAQVIALARLDGMMGGAGVPRALLHGVGVPRALVRTRRYTYILHVPRRARR